MASKSSSIVNLTKTILGAGLLAIPFAFKADGIILGLVLILFAAVASAYGLNIVTRVSLANLPKQETSFFHLCAITYPRLALLFDFSIFIQCFGVALSYLVLIGDLVPALIGEKFDRNQVILLSTVVIGPLVCLKRLDSLKIGSLIGLFAILFLTCLVITHALIDDISQTQGNLKIWTFGKWSDIASSFSIIIFAFTAAQNICTVTNEIANKNDLEKVVSASVGISCLLFTIVGLAGYYQFGDNVLGNVILNYDHDLISTKVGKFALVLMVTLSLPLMFHPCRISLNNMIYWIEIQLFEEFNMNDEETQALLQENFNEGCGDTEAVDNFLGKVPFSNKRFFLITVVLAFSLYSLALSISSFEFVLAMVGATGSTLICFILPGLFGYKLFNSSIDKFWSLILSIWGTAVMIISVYATLYY